jgi:dipeptidyl aminopeptidase/acylaminoacyl peptidase
MNTKRLRQGAIYTLLSMSLLVAACDSGEEQSPEVTSPDPTTSTTGTETTQAGEDGPASTTTTAPADDSTTTSTMAPLEPPSFESVEGINTIGEFSGLTSQGLGLWQEMVPDIEDISITATADDSEQPALWLAPGGEGEKPLLVILHSSSSEYQQHAGIPYAMFADENGWAVIAPQFRGVNDDPESTGSDLAVQDVVDAIDYAVSQDGVDADRVFAVGYSGGGTMSLLLAGRHPDKVTAVAAWGPPYDLIDFYVESLNAGLGYASDIQAACGGDPTDDGEAEEDCLHRSPATHLDVAREEGVPVFIAQGIHDSILSPAHGAGAFNQLAAEDDRFSEEQLETIGQGAIPEDISEPVSAESFFGDGDPAPVLARSSGPALLVFFDADHEMAYQPTLRWFAEDPR